MPEPPVSGSSPRRCFRIEDWAKEHGPYLSRLVQRLLAWSGDWEDVVQEVLVVAWQSRDRFRGDSSLRTWLTGIALRQIRREERRWFRWRRPRREAEASGIGPALDSESVEHPTIETERADAVRTALTQLPISQREALVLYYLEGHPIAEVAALLGVKENAVEVRLHRGRIRLRELLGSLAPEMPINSPAHQEI